MSLATSWLDIVLFIFTKNSKNLFNLLEYVSNISFGSELSKPKLFYSIFTLNLPIFAIEHKDRINPLKSTTAFSFN